MSHTAFIEAPSAANPSAGQDTHHGLAASSCALRDYLATRHPYQDPCQICQEVNGDCLQPTFQRFERELHYSTLFLAAVTLLLLTLAFLGLVWYPVSL
jgi:hypothetical protein